MITRTQQQLIDRQIQDWLSRNRKKTEVKQKVHPVITISREWGAQGSEIASLIKEKLGERWQVWDKEIINAVAKKADVRSEMIKLVDEKSQSKFELFFKSFFGKEIFSQSEYRRHVTAILLALGHHGYTIILDRGSNFVLPYAFRVRVVASRKYRILSLQEKDKVTEEEALFLMRQSDHEKANFVKQVFNENLNDPWNYDLCIKTNYISEKTVAEIIVQGAKDKLGKLA